MKTITLAVRREKLALVSEISFEGDWRVLVLSRSGLAQRVRVTGTAAGEQILAGIAGTAMVVRGNGRESWQLVIEHNYGPGWEKSSMLPGDRSILGSVIQLDVESDDLVHVVAGGTAELNDLVIRVEKVGMVEIPTRPNAIWPATLQMMPEGLFETALGRYFLQVRVENSWSRTWPANARVGLTTRSRDWLAAAGIQVSDDWPPEDQAALGQSVVGGDVVVGALEPWGSTTVYFKVDVASAQVGKHLIEVEVLEPGAPDPGHSNRQARAPIGVTRTSYDPATGIFDSKCDVGTLTVKFDELVVEHYSYRGAIGAARKRFRGMEPGPGGADSGAGGGRACSAGDRERLRRRLKAFLDGRDQDIFGIWRELQACGVAGEKPGDHPRGPWVGTGDSGSAFFVFPTAFSYSVEYNEPFEGQYGPIPFEDPWWKCVLAIVAILLAVAAFVSAVFDLAQRSDDIVIGTLVASVLNPVNPPPEVAPSADEDGSVDAALCRLNGSRSLTPALFSFLDARTGEENVTPIGTLNGLFDSPGTTLSNADISQLFQNRADNPGDPAFVEPLRVFKSGARTGITHGILLAVIPKQERADLEEQGRGVLLNQLEIFADPAVPAAVAISGPGDSGALWLQLSTNSIVALNHTGCFNFNTATASRIEDVMRELRIRFI